MLGQPVTTATLRKKKRDKEPIVMVTAYDYPSARLVEEAGVDVILVGDSLGMVVLGYESTIPVTVDDMLHHTKAVTRGAKRAMVVTDMPFASYHGSIDQSLHHASRIMQEGLTKGVKMEGGREIAHTIESCVRAGIPIMGHLGLTPQSVHQFGGYKVQGKTSQAAQKLLEDAKILEDSGAFSIVLECVPSELAKAVSDQLSIPVIGIGAGVECDGQVLVFHDLLQYASSIRPKFVKSYADIGQYVVEAVSHYAHEVRERSFPSREHSFYMSDESVLQQIYGGSTTK